MTDWPHSLDFLQLQLMHCKCCNCHWTQIFTPGNSSCYDAVLKSDAQVTQMTVISAGRWHGTGKEGGDNRRSRWDDLLSLLSLSHQLLCPVFIYAESVGRSQCIRFVQLNIIYKQYNYKNLTYQMVHKQISSCQPIPYMHRYYGVQLLPVQKSATASDLWICINIKPTDYIMTTDIINAGKYAQNT